MLGFFQLIGYSVIAAIPILLLVILVFGRPKDERPLQHIDVKGLNETELQEVEELIDRIRRRHR